MLSWGRGLKLTFSLQLDWCDKRFSFEHRLCFEVVAERRQLYFGPDHSSSSAQTLQREPSAAMTHVCNNCKRWHSYKILANCSIMHSIIIYREGLDLTLPILPCLQFFGHGGEEYSKCRIEKWNCMLATSTGWRMSSRVESARQLHGKTVHFEAFECVAAKSSKLQSGERHRWRCAYQDRIISASNNNPTSFCGLPPPPTIIWKNSRWSFETWTRTIIWILDNGTHDIWNWRSHRMSTSISLYLELCLLDLSFICPFQPCTHFCQI